MASVTKNVNLNVHDMFGLSIKLVLLFIYYRLIYHNLLVKDLPTHYQYTQ